MEELLHAVPSMTMPTFIKQLACFQAGESKMTKTGVKDRCSNTNQFRHNQISMTGNDGMETSCKDISGPTTWNILDVNF